MLTQLANTIEQLDLAAEHLALGDANNARFALMLSDNIVELTLHQYAKDKRREVKGNSWRNQPFEREKALEKALGRYFDDKVKLVRLIGKLSGDVAESIRIGHLFRNDVYHVGLQHEAVLPAVAAFYYELACQVCADYEVRGWGYSPGQQLPERTKKYIEQRQHFSNFPDQYVAACLALKGLSGHDDAEFTQSLANHMDAIIAEQDEYLDYIAQNAPRRETRDQVVVSSQTWPLAYNDKGRRFASEHGFPSGSIFALVSWLEANYPLKFRRDPIPAWRQRAKRLREQKDSHKVLRMYRSFMDATAELREAINETTSGVDQYIDQQIESARMERSLSKERE